MIEIIAPGPLATVQDGGRPGYAASGVARSGAFDRAALALANRLVGNEAAAAGIEITFGGLAWRVRDAVTVALTGAPCPGLDWARAVSLPAGATVVLGPPTQGLRSYLALRGGLDVEPALGSRSTDTLGGLGPRPLRTGDLLGVAARTAGAPSDAVGAVEVRPRPLRLVPGPRRDWFAPDALRMLHTARWSVAADCDRIGIRLDGPALARARTDELPSEATLPGAVQVPHGGRPIILGPDAPVTGGYPVVAVLCEADLDAAAQLRPGQAVRFDLLR